MHWPLECDSLASCAAPLSGGFCATPNTNSILVSPAYAQMLHWISTTDAELTFVGERPTSLSPRAAQDTVVVSCSTRSGNDCAGPCTVYNGGATCLVARHVNCLFATNDVIFCTDTKCAVDCNALVNCATPLNGGFCATPNTNSILVSPV
ncbi:hypothetical protein C8Q78DRAFT_1066571 [Trametes maxima]|nr:hypothetical protein C8Q78DRAFT_1066571 [Trametes maxima]